MKRSYTSLIASVIVLSMAAPLHAQESPHAFSANVALTTDYLYRGVTQTNEGPAIQGGFDYDYTPWGLYLGIWGSNVEFNTAGNTDDSSIEIDFYGGLKGEVANGINWDVGGLYYYYPDQNEDSGAGDYNFWEVYGGLGYTFEKVTLEPSIGAKVSYSPDFFGEDGDSWYPEGSLDLSLPQGFGLGFHVGYLDVDGDKTTRGFSYTHYSVAVSKELVGFDLALSYNDADDDCEDDFTGDSDFCEAIVFSVSRSF